MMISEPDFLLDDGRLRCYYYGTVSKLIESAVAAERDRWIAKAGAAYTDAHAIFNDPPGETPQEVRDVIEWHLSTMRA